MIVISAKCLTFVSLVGLFAVSASAIADWISAELSGYQANSSQSSAAIGRFKAAIDLANRVIEYQLSYQDLEGNVQQSHIHFKKPGINSGVVTFLCANQKPNSDTSRFPLPACPGTRQGTVTGAILPNDLAHKPLASEIPEAQLIEPKEFNELLDAIDAGAAYVVVDTAAQPAGELRGNLPGR